MQRHLTGVDQHIFGSLQYSATSRGGLCSQKRLEHVIANGFAPMYAYALRIVSLSLDRYGSLDNLPLHEWHCMVYRNNRR